MTAVVLSLVAVVLLVLVVVALGMRSMNNRESSLDPERLKALAERDEQTQTRSTDQFAAAEPRMNSFSPDFSPIDEHRQPKPVRTGQRGKRGVDEWGTPSGEDDDEAFWANIRNDAEEGGFGAGGTVAARKGASRPVASEPAAATGDPHATTVQAALPPRPAAPPVPAPAAASAGLADLMEPAKRPAPATSELADQRTVTFAAPTPDVLSILSGGAQTTPQQRPASTVSSFPAAQPGSGSFPAVNAAGSGSFPAVSPTPIHGAPTSDPFPAAYTNAADPLESTWQAQPPAAPATASGSWPASPSPDILDDPGPSTGSSWPAFEAPVREPAYPASYEVRSGWAAIDDSDALTGPTPASSTPTAPTRAVPAYDDLLSAPSEAYSYGPPATPAAPAAWPEPPAANASWPSYGEMYGTPEAGAQNGQRGGHHRPTPEQEYPDYYR
ncbi:hypothetical protein [Nonomuraea sp. NPDC046570]|uniref:hypothetical protein n=1 Tax=Nonomuraea sp. NPDC046570 TaxID=3155255 RepID=UPI003401C056